MERLTRRSEVGEGLPVNHLNLRHEDTTSEDNLTKILDKLADYEDAEEQGLLFMLPCKIGDTIFTLEDISCRQCKYWNGKPLDIDEVYCSHNYSGCPKEVEEVMVVGYEIREDEIELVKAWDCETETINNPFFLTKAEAEKQIQPPYTTDEEFVNYAEGKSHE